MTTIDSLLAAALVRWDDAKALARIGRELQDRNRLAHARTVLRRALAIDPKVDPEAWEQLAYACYRGYDHGAGDMALREGLAATGSDSLRSTLMNFTEDKEEAKRLRAELESTASPVARASLSWKRLEAGEYEPALAEVKAIHAANPGDAEIRGMLLWVYLSARRAGKCGDLREEAVPLADAAIREAPDRIYGWIMKLMCLSVEKDHDGIIATAREALARFPDEESVMQHLGRAHREKGDVERAVLWLNRAIGAKPSFAGARVDLGRLYEKQGRLDLAEEVFREMPAANPDYPMAPVSLALFLTRQGRLPEAEDVFVAAWPRLVSWQRDAVKSNPEAAPLLARERVKAIIEG